LSLMTTKMVRILGWKLSISLLVGYFHQLIVYTVNDIISNLTYGHVM
jgi:hypothetical protein